MIAVFLSTLIPYHHARWNAYSSRHPGECLLIDITSRDAFRVLEFDAGNTSGYRRVTLFPGASFDRVSNREMRRAVQRILDEHKPSVVCLNGYSVLYNWVALRWCLKNNVPAIICSESNEFDEVRRPWKEAVKSCLLRQCAAGLAGGQPQVDYLVKLGLPRERIFTGYNVVDNAHFAAGADAARERAAFTREKLALPENYFLACCRFVLKKNLPLLIKAYARYRTLALNAKSDREEAKIWDLVVIGDGEEKALIESVIAEQQVVPYVHLAGAKTYDQLPAYYGLASAFIHASTTEQWGLVVNEAMASGLPVLVSNRCGCAPDLVKEGINGFTFDPGDEADIARKMLQLATDAPLRSVMGGASRKIIANWSPEKFAQGMAQGVEVALARPPSTPSWFDHLIIWMMQHR